MTPQKKEEPSKLGRLMECREPRLQVMQVHWMPKEEEEWTCPVCGRYFLKVSGKGWTEPWFP